MIAIINAIKEMQLNVGIIFERDLNSIFQAVIEILGKHPQEIKTSP
ncbi:hypothetical protein [Candidatus Arsenophonus triatominarum]|nr:hypothetical protein [Candidatus Arsenophonus triatominarum]